MAVSSLGVSFPPKGLGRILQAKNQGERGPMKDPVVHEALRPIQEIVSQETGNALAPGARMRVQNVLTSAMGQLAGVRGNDKTLTRDVTILLADLRGFTSISSNYPAFIVLDMLNRCFVRMSEIIFQNHGGIDKFMGDSILAVFRSGPKTRASAGRRTDAPPAPVRAFPLSCPPAR